MAELHEGSATDRPFYLAGATMYVPPTFIQTDLQTLHDFMEQHSFATVVSMGQGEPVATHVPLLLQRKGETDLRLSGHFARVNSQWTAADGQRVLVIFQGPHAYISPSWYAADNVVPTWNYAVVHAYGTMRLIEQKFALRQLMEQTVSRYEQSMPQPWSLNRNSENFIDRLLTMIVGFQINVDRIEGQWKLSQNHEAPRRERVIRALLKSDEPADREVAHLMMNSPAKNSSEQLIDRSHAEG